MSLFSDISNLVGGDYATEHILDAGTTVSVQLATGDPTTKAAVTDLLTGHTLNVNDPDALLTTGQTVSTYGVEAELTIVSITEQAEEPALWVHAFQYGTLADYNSGVILQQPDVSLRV